MPRPLFALLQDDDLTFVQVLPLLLVAVVIAAGIVLADRLRVKNEPWYGSNPTGNWTPVDTNGRELVIPFGRASASEDALTVLYRRLTIVRRLASWTIGVSVFLLLGFIGRPTLALLLPATLVALSVAIRTQLTQSLESIREALAGLFPTGRRTPPIHAGTLIDVGFPASLRTVALAMVTSFNGDSGEAQLLTNPVTEEALADRPPQPGAKRRGDTVRFFWNRTDQIFCIYE